MRKIRRVEKREELRLSGLKDSKNSYAFLKRGNILKKLKVF
jgi:hypothetical protein